MVPGSHEVKASDTRLRARRGGTASLVLKAFLITGTVGLFVWEGFLPNDDSEPPVAWDVLLFALPAAALVLLVLRLLRRRQPLMPYAVRGYGWRLPCTSSAPRSSRPGSSLLLRCAC